MYTRHRCKWSKVRNDREIYCKKRRNSKKNRKYIYADRRNFISSDCAIDALLLVDGNTFDSCKGCSNFEKEKDTLCVCMKLGLQELR